MIKNFKVRITAFRNHLVIKTYNNKLDSDKKYSRSFFHTDFYCGVIDPEKNVGMSIEAFNLLSNIPISQNEDITFNTLFHFTGNVFTWPNKHKNYITHKSNIMIPYNNYIVMPKTVIRNFVDPQAILLINNIIDINKNEFKF
jgi:hypothetical protein